MKKLLFWGLLLLLPSLLFAQTNQTVVKDFEKKVQRLTHTFQLSDHVNIAQIATDEGFELLAIDDKMQVLWRISLSGGEAMSGVFKGNILATSATGKSKKGPMDYNAYLIDAQTGKLLLQKQIYESTYETWEVPQTLFAKDGSWARLVVRQTTVKGQGWIVKSDLMATRQLTVFELNDKLEPTTTQCNLQEGVYIGTVRPRRKALRFSPVSRERRLKRLNSLMANLNRSRCSPRAWISRQT